MERNNVKVTSQNNQQIHPNPNRLVKTKALKSQYEDEDSEPMHPELEDDENQVK